MTKNLHFLLILGLKHDISKRHLKRCILTLFLRFFWPEMTSKKFKSMNKYELSYLVEKKFWSIFALQGNPYHKKKLKFFSQLNMTIHTPFESPCRCNIERCNIEKCVKVQLGVRCNIA
jgi:hypothetical protein